MSIVPFPKIPAYRREADPIHLVRSVVCLEKIDGTNTRVHAPADARSAADLVFGGRTLLENMPDFCQPVLREAFTAEAAAVRRLCELVHELGRALTLYGETRGRGIQAQGHIYGPRPHFVLFAARSAGAWLGFNHSLELRDEDEEAPRTLPSLRGEEAQPRPGHGRDRRCSPPVNLRRSPAMASHDRDASIFRHRHVVLPVIHVVSEEQALRNAKIAREAHADGVFLINHGMSWRELLRIHEVVDRAFPGWWIGVNCLDLGPEEVFDKIPASVAGVWVDDGRVREDQAEQTEAAALARVRAAAGKPALLFGGVAFKYQRAVDDVAKAARIAAGYMDVVTTSGPGTGHAADVAKIRAMKQALGATPLAIASGITPENVGEYLPIADCFLVATGISSSFDELDKGRVAALVDRVHAYRPPLPAYVKPYSDGRWMETEDALPSDWAQRSVYGQPLFARSFRELAGRISQWNASDAVVLRLFGGREVEGQALAGLLRTAGCPLAARYSEWRSSSAAPIEDGYLRCLRLRPNNQFRVDDPVEPVATIEAFLRAEKSRFEQEDIEAHLRTIYGELSAERQRDPRFHYIDYPAFDSGATAVGFGVLIHEDIWVWSRVVHYHK